MKRKLTIGFAAVALALAAAFVASRRNAESEGETNDAEAARIELEG